MQLILLIASRLSLIVLLATIGCSKGLSNQLQFMVEVSSLHGPWHAKDAFFKGNDVNMTCATSDGSSSMLKIRKLDESNETMAVEHRDKRVHRILHSIQCHKMGVYACEDDQGQSTTFDLGIYDCDPLPCPPRKDQTETAFVAINGTTTFSLCILAHPGISFSALLDEKAIRARQTFDDMWEWNFEQGPSSASTYIVNVTVTQMKGQYYGKHNLTLSTSQQGQRKLEYTLELREPGPPDCPTNVQMISRGSDYVEISWQPGPDGGSNQSFSVFIKPQGSKDWHRDKSLHSIEVTHATVRDLKSDTSYTLSVVPTNVDFDMNLICDERTLDGQTEKDISPANLSCPALVEGNTADSSVTCKMRGSDVSGLRWSVTFRRQDSTAHASCCHSAGSSSPGYQVSVETVQGEITAILTIQEVGKEDEGVWLCSFASDEADNVSSQCNLSVQDAGPVTDRRTGTGSKKEGAVGGDIIVAVVAVAVILVLIIGVVTVTVCWRRSRRSRSADVYSISSGSTSTQEAVEYFRIQNEEDS